MNIFYFQAKKKEAKKSPGHLRLCPGPRNAFLVSAKPCRVAPLNSFRCERKQTIVLLLLGQAFVDCPNKMAAGAPPYGRKGRLYMTNEIIRFKIYHLPLLQITIGQPRTSVPTILSVA